MALVCIFILLVTLPTYEWIDACILIKKRKEKVSALEDRPSTIAKTAN